MLFSFIIPTIDDGRVKDTIRSIIFSNGWDRDDCEVIIVVNNCLKVFYEELHSKLLDLVKSGCIKLLFLEKATIGGARNMGIKKAQGEYVIHLDSDCMLEKNYIKKLREYIDINQISIARGVVEFISSKSLISKANCQLKDLAYSSRKNTCYAPNLIVKRGLYMKVGLFNTVTVYGEDTEWSLRSENLRVAPIFLEDLVIKHFDFKKNTKILLNYFYYGEARYYRLKENAGKYMGMKKKINLLWQMLDEVPNLQTIHSFTCKLSIVFLYFVRNIGVIYGVLRQKDKK